MDLWGRRAKADEAHERRQGARVQLVIAAAATAAVLVAAAALVLDWTNRSSGQAGPAGAVLAEADVGEAPAGRTEVALAASIVNQQQPNNAVVPRPASELGTPPDFEPDVGQQESHCDEWHQWLNELGAAILSPHRLEVSSPAETASTITDVKVRVFRRFTPATTTFVSCVYGAGGEDPNRMRIDLERPDAPVRLTATDVRTLRQRHVEIPDGFFTVAAGRTETIAVEAHGADGYFYEWGLELTVIVDRRRTIQPIGSARRPLRTWFGAPTDGVDWDPNARRWVSVP